MTGALTQIDIRGEGGQSFKDKWADGPRTYLGLQTAGFPNLFIATNTAFCNYTVCAEMIVEWITDCIRYMREKNLKRIAPTPQAEEAWVEHAAEVAARTLFARANSWFMGANIPGKKRAILLYANTAPPIGRSVRRSRPRAMKDFTCNEMDISQLEKISLILHI